MYGLRPNGSRLSCGALVKESSFNILRAASFKRWLGRWHSGLRAGGADPPGDGREPQPSRA